MKLNETRAKLQSANYYSLSAYDSGRMNTSARSHIISVNNLKHYNEGYCLIRQKIVRAERLIEVNSRQLGKLLLESWGRS